LSEDLEMVHTINLGKVLLSQPQHRSTRALNMIREFARRHMKVEVVKIDEDLAKHIWARGARRPPRKVRVVMTRDDSGDALVYKYDVADELMHEQAPAIDSTSASTTANLPKPTAAVTDALPLPEPVAETAGEEKEEEEEEDSMDSGEDVKDEEYDKEERPPTASSSDTVRN